MLTGKKGMKVKPGLSSFATHPEDLAAYIKPLFVAAKEEVPQSQWPYTKVYIKATAGMRLVTEEQVVPYRCPWLALRQCAVD